MYKIYQLYPQGYSSAPSMFNRGCLLAFKRQARGFQHKEISLGFTILGQTRHQSTMHPPRFLSGQAPDFFLIYLMKSSFFSCCHPKKIQVILYFFFQGGKSTRLLKTENSVKIKGGVCWRSTLSCCLIKFIGRIAYKKRCRLLQHGYFRTKPLIFRGTYSVLCKN